LFRYAGVGVAMVAIAAAGVSAAVVVDNGTAQPNQATTVTTTVTTGTTATTITTTTATETATTTETTETTETETEPTDTGEDLGEAEGGGAVEGDPDFTG
jgi:hypothetical protein